MQFFKHAAFATPFLVSLGTTAVAQNQVTGNAFNPAISLILDGHYASYSRDPAGYGLAGFQLDAEAGLPDEGLSLDETELVMSTNVDDKYYGVVTAAFEQSGGETSVGVEEAYFETLALPQGLKIKAGQFLSDVGYLNPIHAHAWDFNDAPLAYVAMLNTGYKDAGVQLSWVVPSTLYIQLGAELLRGDSFPGANGAANNGSGASTLLVHFGGDVGDATSWRAGVSHLTADASDRATDLPTGRVSFTGTSDLTIADFVWKWAKGGNSRDRYYVIQAEYLHRKENGDLTVSAPLASDEIGPYSGTQDGFYVQGVYQFRPRWRVALRYDSLEASNDLGVTGPTPLLADHEPSRISVMTDFSNSEFSRLRLQINRDDSRSTTDNQIVFQYLMSLGAHGAHRF